MNERRYIDLPPARARLTRARRMWRGAAGALGLIPYATLAHLKGLPGLEVRFRIASLAARALRNRSGGAPSSTMLYEMFCFPMDSTRYFEFDFMWRKMKALEARDYLDVSSPRLLPLLFVDSRAVSATFVNPDANDLAQTEALSRACLLGSRCRFENCLLQDLDVPPDSFDVVTCISVLEHIRNDEDAVRLLWRAVKPGGRLLLSMPAAARGEEQLINVQNYAFAGCDADGFVFHQYLYDQKRLGRLFSVTGPPASCEVYGEHEPGFHLRLYERKWIDADYPFWREPWFMTSFAKYESVDRLQGEGVVLLEFIK